MILKIIKPAKTLHIHVQACYTSQLNYNNRILQKKKQELIMEYTLSGWSHNSQW
jgi:hypothetical protein